MKIEIREFSMAIQLLVMHDKGMTLKKGDKSFISLTSRAGTLPMARGRNESGSLISNPSFVSLWIFWSTDNWTLVYSVWCINSQCSQCGKEKYQGPVVQNK
jgi:hypothetical protein